MLLFPSILDFSFLKYDPMKIADTLPNPKDKINTKNPKCNDIGTRLI